ncbi:MAG: tyrosine--tRNA ligase [Candidatus Melainabacteria bacterium RIFCSPHIGHO2_02_FULL_34_12]|nr:MAG: tyrosine--tRNA ligase [Candidatus Melainabacteria bacterium RIFCSPHIGHO2_02_FULL_34_12]
MFLPNGALGLAELFHKADKEKKTLRVKLGIDPTTSDLHLGHTVCLQMLKKFQDLGHKPVLIIGGFTATVGDPSGRNEARPPLSIEEVKNNSKTYLNQISKILDLEKVEILNNYDWLNDLRTADLIKLAHLVTINQLVGKEAFGSRIENGQPLYLHEVLYPILQGYDSVYIKADIEVGGIDQTFNVLFGRHMQKHFKQDEQLVILLPLLIGLDGTKKMSKTFNNLISLKDSPDEVFGKAMSIPDELIIHYFKLVTNEQIKQILSYEEDMKNGKNPRDVKMVLAHRLVKQLYDENTAIKSEENFIKQFRKNEIPEKVDEYILKEPLKIIDLMYLSKMVSSKAEAKRLIQGGGVKLRSNTIDNPNLLITMGDKNSVLQIGKRKFVKII